MEEDAEAGWIAAGLTSSEDAGAGGKEACIDGGDMAS